VFRKQSLGAVGHRRRDKDAPYHGVVTLLTLDRRNVSPKLAGRTRPDPTAFEFNDDGPTLAVTAEDIDRAGVGRPLGCQRLKAGFDHGRAVKQCVAQIGLAAGHRQLSAAADGHCRQLFDRLETNI
jgi:hypothetical protein